MKTTHTSEEDHNAQAARIKRHAPFTGANLRQWPWDKLAALLGVRVNKANELKGLADIVADLATNNHQVRHVLQF